jgi:hypothetical protein
VLVYAICKDDGSLFLNQSFLSREEAENKMNEIIKDHKELCKTFNRPQPSYRLISVVQLDPTDYEVALKKMDDELVEALNSLEVEK